MSFSTTKKNLEQARSLKSGGILIGGMNKPVKLRGGFIRIENKYGKSIPKKIKVTGGHNG